MLQLSNSEEKICKCLLLFSFYSDRCHTRFTFEIFQSCQCICYHMEIWARKYFSLAATQFISWIFHFISFIFCHIIYHIQRTVYIWNNFQKQNHVFWRILHFLWNDLVLIFITVPKYYIMWYRLWLFYVRFFPDLYNYNSTFYFQFFIFGFFIVQFQKSKIFYHEIFFVSKHLESNAKSVMSRHGNPFFKF